MARDPIATVGARLAQFGDTYRVGEPGNALFVTKDPEHARQVLVSGGAVFGKGHASFRALRTVIGDSLLTSEGDTWRRQRRLVQPAFSRSRLVTYADVFAEETAALVTRLRATSGETHDMSAAMMGLTLRIVARSLFGQAVDHTSRIGRGMQWLQSAFGRIDPLAMLPKGVPTPGRRRARQAIGDLNSAVFEVIGNRRDLLNAGGDAPDDLLQRLLDARDDEGDGQGLSDRELRDTLLTLYLAGHDTTSHAVSWTLFLLARHPEAMARAQEEVDQVLGGQPAGLSHLASMPFIEAAFKEAMRLYPPVVAIPRRATAETTLGNYRVLPGDEAIVWIWHMQRHPAHHSDPESFRPERFLGQQAAQTKQAFMPFGAGQRVCIGQMFATMEAQIILAGLLQGLNLSLASDRHPGLRFGVTLAPKDGVPMRVAPR